MKTIVTQLPLMGARIGNRPLRVGEFVPAAAMTARRVSLEELQLMLEGTLPGSVKQSHEPLGPNMTVSPAIPELIAKHYLDDNLRDGLEALCNARRLRSIELTAKYGGVMPESVRENIHKWSNVPQGQPRFDDIVIVAEAPEESWQVKEIPRGDPLVVGVAHGLLWLIDAYDLTPFELFASELCTNSSKAHN